MNPHEKINCLEQDERLYDDDNFVARMAAIDFLELHAPDTARAELLKQRLDAANERLFARLLASIRARDHATLRAYFEDVARQTDSQVDEETIGYDELDILLNGLLEVPIIPGEPEERDPDMVFYQPTPARIILKLLEQLDITADDIFYDLGSGLGHVPILVNLLTGIRTRGIEIESAYFRYSTECLKKLCLTDVDFMNVDAREATYDDGTIFYMYTPFQGEILRQTLSKLEAQSQQRQIKVCTYGPCTALISKQSWLQSIYQTGKAEGRFGLFAST